MDTLFSPGEVSFRCGDHPVVDLECGYSGNGSSRSDADDIGGGEGGGDGSVPVFYGESSGGDDDGGGGVAVLFNGLAREAAGEAAAREAGAAAGKRILEAAGGTAGMGGGDVGADPGQEEDNRPAAAGDAAAGERRVWVLHNFLAVRGFRRHQLDGIAAWLANSTLSLLSPDPEPADRYYDDLSGGTGCGNGSIMDVFRFHRAFDGDSGLPLPGPEGNSSSVAASVWVLLLLGDEPDGGNDFPPITHATL